jgi:hypothetical protein
MKERIKTKAEARAALAEANAAIDYAAQLLRPHAALFEQFRRDQSAMESFGSILDPTLFLSSERRAVEALLAPLYQAADKFLATVDRQKARARAALDGQPLDVSREKEKTP